MADSSAQRTKAFISYSHKDRKFLNELEEHLAYFERQGRIQYWDDQKLNPGDPWEEEINQAINSAKVAIFLISRSFLASDFINRKELLPLLEAAQKEGTLLLLVIVRPCLFKHTTLAKFQAVHDTSKPLSEMKPSERDRIWVKVAELVSQALTPTTPAITAPLSATESTPAPVAPLPVTPPTKHETPEHHKGIQPQQEKRWMTAKQVARALRLAQTAQTEGRIADAINLCEQVINSGFDSPDICYFLGWLYQGQERWQEAIQQFGKVLNDSDYALSGYYALGRCYQAVGDLKAATQYFDMAVDTVDLDALKLEESDQLIQLCYGAAEAHRALGELGQTETIYSMLLGFLRSRGWQDQIAEVERKIAKGGIQGATPAQATRPNGPPTVTDPLTAIFSQTSGPPTISFQKDSSGIPPLPEPLRSQVIASVRDIEKYVAHGLLTAAIEECLRVIEMAPQYLDVHLMLGEIYVKQGKTEQAITKYANLIDTYLVQGRVDDAIATYRRILELEPNNLTYRVRLINLLASHGRTDELRQ